MGLIVYNEKTLMEAKNKIDVCNDEILDALKKINYEFENIKSTLDTPKSSKAIPSFIEYINQKINYVQNNKDNFNRIFNTINSEYHDYANTINRMVGGSSEK